MKIVLPYAKLLPPVGGESEFTPGDGIALLRKIEWAARVSHRSEDAQKADSYERFIRTVVLDHGDWSVVEHATVSVDMLVDRGVTHELVRHRLFSYTQESTRFVNYDKKMETSFIYPIPDVSCSFCLACEALAFNVPAWTHESPHGRVPCPYNPAWLSTITDVRMKYTGLLSDGWRPQEARSVLPNALASRIIVTGNLRNWRHVFLMRTTREAHPQMRQVMIPLLQEFQQKIPILFEDIAPDARQVDNLRKPR